MAQAKKKKVSAKTYVCVICDKKKKSSKKVTCCGKGMVTEDRGTWNV